MHLELVEGQVVGLLQSDKGRRTVFEWLVKQHKEQVYYFIRRMVLNHDDADDVTQQTFLKAWKGLEKFRGDSKLSTWLIRIAHNESITFINNRKKLAGIPFDDIAESLDRTLEADVLYDGDEIQRKLQVAIAQLPDKQKAVFIMRYYDEMPYAEMSEITGTSVGALKASYHHAVQKIEAHLLQND
ncbi:MAG: sigma-70 family RNA polymerase sigma factor [Cryomorphaceae bacterium]|nr:sigma-70 family RNA polymerase sigma factor [Cryomorphaceae bacterium]